MPNATLQRSPHYNKRPAGTVIDCLVLHADAGTSEAGTISWILSPQSKVSYHYLVGRDGTVTQFVPDELRAWHAGASVFRDRKNVNDFSLGVSFANHQRGEGFKAAQLAAGRALVADLIWKHKIPLARITTHAAISPGRKFDPGPLFALATFLTDVGAEIARRRTEGAE